MRRVFSVELSGGNGLYCELELPASAYQLLDMQERLNMKSGDLPEWEICEHHCFEFLAPFLDDDINFYELNALCQKLGALDGLQSTAFDGLLQMEINKREGPIGIDKLMSLAQNVDCCHVVGEALNDSQLGRFYAENGFIPAVEKVPDEIFELLDFEMLGRKARMGEGGVYTQDGYVVPHSGITQHPYTQPQPPQKPDYIFRLVLNVYPFEDEETHVWHDLQLDLPAEEAELDAALVKLGSPPWSEVVIGVEDSAIPELLDDVECSNGLEQINRLAMAVKWVDETGQLMKYKAVLQATGCTDLSMAEELAWRLDEYILDSGSRSVEDVARGELRTMIDGASVETLLPHLNLYGYGLDVMKRDNSELTPYGLVERGNGQPVQMSRTITVDGGDEIIGSLDEFAKWFGCDGVDRLARALYKNTDCGMCYSATEDSITLIGYVEGADCEHPSETLIYPFTGSHAKEVMSALEAEADAMWHDWNDQDKGEQWPNKRMEMM